MLVFVITSTTSTIFNDREREENQARTVVPFSSFPMHLSCSLPSADPSLSSDDMAATWQLQGSYMVRP